MAIMEELGSRLKEYRIRKNLLRVLDMLENIEEFIPEPPISPILMRDLKGKKRYRVRS